MPRVLRGRCAGGAHDDRDGRDHWIPAVSAEATPTASSPNAVAESIQHSQQSKSPRLRVSAGISGIARIACRSRPRPRRLRLRGVDGRRHPAGGDPYRPSHCQSARACTSTGGTSTAAARLSCSVRCNSWAMGSAWTVAIPPPQASSCDTVLRYVAGVATCRGPSRRGLRPRGGGYDLSRSHTAGVTTSRRELHLPPRRTPAAASRRVPRHEA